MLLACSWRSRIAASRVSASKGYGRQYSTVVKSQKKTIHALHEKHKENVPISMVTCYDYTSAKFVDKAGIDAVLVGDSYSMVVSGHDTTVPATLEEIIYHAKAVSRGISEAMVVGDMPFGSYEVSDEDALRSAFRLMKEGRVDSVKLEGGKRVQSRVKALVAAGIPVMGHIGLTPQTLSALGGFKVQGNTLETAISLVEDGKALQEAGCYAIVIEGVPEKIANFITSQLSIPTIGIGAGKGTSGQVLVWHDVFGLYSDCVPKFAKIYVDLGPQIVLGLEQYKQEVESREFPTEKHAYKLKQNVWDEFRQHYDIPTKESTSTKIAQEQNYTNPVLASISQESNVEASTVAKSSPYLSSQLNIASVPKEDRIKKKIAIIGAGAMGSLVASQLVSNNKSPTSPYDVETWLVSGWVEHIEKIKKQGIIIEDSGNPSTHITDVRATASLREIIANGPLDIIFILVKTPETRVAAEKAKLLLVPGHETVIITLQNGLGNMEVIQDILDASPPDIKYKLLQGVTDQGAMLLSPGTIKQTGKGTTTIAGDANNEAAVMVRDLLHHGGMDTRLNPDVEGVVWGKLILNAAINPLTAIFGLENGQLATNAKGKAILKLVIEEAMIVAKARGVVLPYGQDLSVAVENAERVLHNTAKNKSSMLVDILRGVGTEIDSINGAIVKEGEKLGLDVGLNKSLVQLVRNLYRNGAESTL